MDKTKVSNTVARLILILEQRKFTAKETQALIDVLQTMLHQRIFETAPTQKAGDEHE